MTMKRRTFLASSVALAAAPRQRSRAASLPTPADLCYADAHELVKLIAARKLSAKELMQAHLKRIAAVNGKVNALVAKLPDEECLARAAAFDEQLAKGNRPFLLGGLPWAFKDLEEAQGFVCSEGSPIFKDYRPDFDTLLVQRLKAAGVVPIAKTNVPEFGMGSHSYNKVYGTTHNPYDLSRSAGGSSGGAGAGLASGMLPLADGSDLGGSLRNPGNFNNIVGYRPSVGLVPDAPDSMPLAGFGVKGPLGRSVTDVALMLSVIAGPDARAPLSYPSDPASFRTPLARELKGLRVAFAPDLGGLPVEPEVRAVLDAQRGVFEKLGWRVEEAVPDFSGAEDVFLTLRRWRTYVGMRDLLPKHRDELKPEAIGEIEAGSKITADDLARVYVEHGKLLERMRQFHERYDLIACPVNQVAPFDASWTWPKSINGTPMTHYIEWMKSAWLITATWQPAVSMPAGFTPGGLPVGIQLVAPLRADRRLLEAAYAFEQATQVAKRRPKLT
jgi:amidase